MSIFSAVRKKWGSDLEDIIVDYPFIFGYYKKGLHRFVKISDYHKKGKYNTDNWGCVWYNSHGGYEGQVVEHPIASYDALKEYEPPDPLKYTERGKQHWRGKKIALWWLRRKNRLTAGSGERLFDRLYFLRGFNNLMVDFARDDPNLPKLIKMLEEHELKMVKKWLTYNVDIVNFHTDIGTQSRLMIRPEKFRQYIKPMFKSIFQTCRKAGSHVYLSSDGHLLEIVDDLIECGVSVHDPQARANTLEGIKKHYKGKMCVDLDLDRQLFPFASPDEIKEHIYKAVELLNSPEGGFMMKAEISDMNVPLENIRAICDAFMETCCPER